MITYFYWLVLAGLVIASLFGIGVRLGKWKPAMIVSLILLVVGTLLYYFWLQQIFVKRFGGHMTLSIPAGQQHLTATWKDDNLWIENYDPKTNTCIFSEYSRGNVLQGEVRLKNCNPIHAQSGRDTAIAPQE
ncbi:MAG: DUF4149 domain-containing protein [Gammaproteobacteria bacterium]|jgi:Zn-dependent protease with chaperone function|nr:DUF4149 domain-containing protein [Gammaproteobacteria bacterium]MBQ0775148.1 DUF4149 domain-containing protein [Gammaproteobacteria bacterium]|tara:strand:+ start:88095 stop:88490 length:396 start_codon:yes stop_codon:yes gene_type:complete